MRKFAVAVVLKALGYLATGGHARADGLFNPLIIGALNPDGTSQFTTNTFTSSHPNTGVYVLSFAPWVFFNKDPICIVNPIGIGLFVFGEGAFPNTCKFTIVNQSGSASDAYVAFMAGPATGTPAQ